MKNVIGFIVVVILAAGLLWLIDNPGETPGNNIEVTETYTKAVTEEGTIYVFTPGIDQAEIDKVVTDEGEFVEDGELKYFIIR